MRSFSIKNKRVYVAGHKGMVGSSLVRRLAQENCTILTASRDIDLRDQLAVLNWLKVNKPDVVVIAAAKVGGIYANSTKPAEFIYDNLMIASNLIHASKEINVSKLLFLGSTCIYPKNATSPINEESLLSGYLEPTNQWYAIAKIAGLKMAEAYRYQYDCDFISCTPTNLYGPYDNYNLQNSHVLPALLRKIHEAKKQNEDRVKIWGTGKPKREFLFVDDLADACIFLIENYSGSKPVNIGVGHNISITSLAQMIADVVGFHGEFTYDQTMPDGFDQRLLDISYLKSLGWVAKTDLETGISIAYGDYLNRFG